jgi:hypothetical protein
VGNLIRTYFKTQYVLLAPFALVLLMQFNNCSKYKQPGEESSSISANTPLSDLGEVKAITLTGDVCEDEIRQHFYEGYYQMAVANCIQCHAVDNDKPQFAHPDANWAYEVFQTRGYTKISNNAISSTHNPPATGTHLATEINQLKAKWRLAVDDYNVCKKLPPVVEQIDPRSVVNFQTTARTIGALAVGASTWKHWNINSEIQTLKQGVTLPVIPGGARFSIKITRRQTAAGTDYYTFTEPVIWDNTNRNVKIKTLYIKVNGRVMNYATTFKFINKFIYPGVNIDENSPTPQNQIGYIRGLASAGALMVIGTTSPSDVVNIAFEELRDAPEAPALPSPVTVGFANTAVRFVNPTSTGLDSDRKMRVRVQVNGNAEAPVVMAVNRINDSLCSAVGDAAFRVNTTSCLPNIYNALGASLQNTNNTIFNRARSRDDTITIRNDAGADIPVKIFDWDFKIINPTFTLLGNNAFVDIEIEFSGDIRRENNRVLRLQLESLSEFGTIVNGEIFIIIHKADNPNALLAGEVTYSSLMRTGTLRTYCMACHNSNSAQGGLQGGYDITNYKLMTSANKLVLDLNDPLNSKMFNRMTPNYPGNETLTPMPRSGFLEDRFIDPVRRWIQAGAKNN